MFRKTHTRTTFQCHSRRGMDQAVVTLEAYWTTYDGIGLLPTSLMKSDPTFFLHQCGHIGVVFDRIRAKFYGPIPGKTNCSSSYQLGSTILRFTFLELCTKSFWVMDAYLRGGLVFSMLAQCSKDLCFDSCRCHQCQCKRCNKSVSIIATNYLKLGVVTTIETSRFSNIPRTFV